MDVSLLRMFLYIVVKALIIEGAPRHISNKNRPGPCVGGDCLHGLLMHGDATYGNDHTQEDKYEALQRADLANMDKSQKGPCMGADCMEKVNHDWKDVEKEHNIVKARDIGPGEEKTTGPCQGADCLHGVLMHGDATHGISHEREHEKGRVKAKAEHEGKKTNVDPSIALHGEEGADIHNRPKQVVEDGEVRHPKMLLDAHSMLHGGEDVDHTKQIHARSSTNDNIGVYSMDQVLHGSDVDVHSKKKKGAMFSPESIEKKVAEEYAQWKQTNEGQEEGKDNSFTFPFLSEGILNEIEMFRRRYVSKFWGSDEDATEGNVKADASETETQNAEGKNTPDAKETQAEQTTAAKNQRAKPKRLPLRKIPPKRNGFRSDHPNNEI